MLELSQTIAALLAIVAAIGTVGSLLLQRVQIAKLTHELADLRHQRDLQLEKLRLEVQRLRESTGRIYKPTAAEVADIGGRRDREVWGTRLGFPIGLTLARGGLLLVAYILLAMALPAARTPGAIVVFLVLLVLFIAVYQWQGVTLTDCKVRLEKERAALEGATARPTAFPSERV